MKKIVFSESEITFIVTNVGKISVNKMAQIFNCSKNPIAKIVNKYEHTPFELKSLSLQEQLELKEIELKAIDVINKLPERKNSFFSNAQTAFILTNLNTLSIYKMAQTLKCSKKPIIRLLSIHEATPINLMPLTQEEQVELNNIYDSIDDKYFWTEEKIEYLKEHWGVIKIETIAQILNKSEYALKKQAFRLNLGPKIDNNLLVIKLIDLSTIFKVSITKIKKWGNMGLKVTKTQVSNKKYYLTTTLDELYIFLKEHPEEWDSKNVEKNIFGIEPEWFKEKRIKDKESNIKYNNNWTKFEEAQASLMYLKGLSYEEIGQELNRTGESVRTKLRRIKKRL